MRLLEAYLPADQTTAEVDLGRRRASRRRARVPVIESGELVDQPIMINSTSGRDHQGRRPVVAAPVPDDLRPRHRRDRFRGADHRPAQTDAGQHLGGHQFGHEFGRIVAVHGDLVQDHRPLGVHVVAGDQGIADHVRQHVDHQRTVAVQHPGVEAGVLLGRVRVELPADRLDRGRDLLGGPRRGSLEQHVFEEVRGAVQRRRLLPGADAGEHADRRGPAGPDGFGDQLQPVGQHRAPDRLAQAVRRASPSTTGNGAIHRLGMAPRAG